MATNLMTFKNEKGEPVHPNPYQIGDIYLTTRSEHPNTLWGGTWSRLPYGFLLNWETGAAKDTGGSFTTNATAITVAQMPAHSHTQNSHNHTQNAHGHDQYITGTDGNRNPWVTNASGGSAGVRFYGQTAYHSSGKTVIRTGNTTPTNVAATATNQNTGGGGGHTHYHEPPWVKIYAWVRTA